MGGVSQGKLREGDGLLFAQFFLQDFTRPEDAGFDGAEGDLQNLADLFVGAFFSVSEDDGNPVALGKRVDGFLNLYLF